MVELFTAPGFAEGPRLRSKSRSRLSPGRRLPTPAELNEPPWARTPRTGFSPASSTTASNEFKESLEVFLCRPDSLFQRTFSRSDRTPGLLSRAGRRRPGHPFEDYSDEPPSNRTSPYRGIRLYGSASRRMVNPAPFGWLVRPTCTGDAAHLEDVSNAPRR